MLDVGFKVIGKIIAHQLLATLSFFWGVHYALFPIVSHNGGQPKLGSENVVRYTDVIGTNICHGTLVQCFVGLGPTEFGHVLVHLNDFDQGRPRQSRSRPRAGFHVVLFICHVVVDCAGHLGVYFFNGGTHMFGPQQHDLGIRHPQVL